MKTLNTLIVALAFATFATPAAMAQDMKTGQRMDQHGMSMAKPVTSGAFHGVEVNGGTVSFSMDKGVGMLSVSKDFALPKSPAPHWQIVDAKGNVYLLNQFRIAGDKTNLTIRLPKYITSVAKVQVWCSYAEVVLGEAKFDKVVMVH